MAIIKCKMCGGDLTIDESMTVGTCNFCGSVMTLPSQLDEQKLNLYNRANHYRRDNEFDKAAGIYESILNQDATEAEAYWGLVLCKYGIEYVEDPETHKKVPTCHRAQYGSILVDNDYKAALDNADLTARPVYEAEAAAIDKIQKEILAVSAKTEPFDVFICYKEQSEAGTRTPDSVLAQDLYYQLKGEGFNVFFSRITLEDKLGSAYEPTIFAALNSARVMVVIATKPEYVNAVWVKNEWSRYLALINQGEKKTLIPAYRDMDPYDLPDDFAHLQALDMSKLGFMQDLLRGIKKLLEEPGRAGTQNDAFQNEAYNPTEGPLLDRAFLVLEDGDFDKADQLLEQVLNLNPRNAKAYVGKLMVRYKLRKESQIGELRTDFWEDRAYQKAIRFGSESYRLILEGYRQAVVKRIGTAHEIARKEEIYQRGIALKKQWTSIGKFKQAAELFKQIKGYKDADELAERCIKLHNQQEFELKATKKAAEQENRIWNYGILIIGIFVVVIITLLLIAILSQ